MNYKSLEISIKEYKQKLKSRKDLIEKYKKQLEDLKNKKEQLIKVKITLKTKNNNLLNINADNSILSSYNINNYISYEKSNEIKENNK